MSTVTRASFKHQLFRRLEFQSLAEGLGRSFDPFYSAPPMHESRVVEVILAAAALRARLGQSDQVRLRGDFLRVAGDLNKAAQQLAEAEPADAHDGT